MHNAALDNGELLSIPWDSALARTSSYPSFRAALKKDKISLEQLYPAMYLENIQLFKGLKFCFQPSSLVSPLN